MHYNHQTILLEGKHRFTSLKNIPANYLLNQAKSTKDILLREYININYDILVARDFFENKGKSDIADSTCTKIPYSDENEARTELFRIARRNQIHRKPVRIYLCSCGAYHLTSTDFNPKYEA